MSILNFIENYACLGIYDMYGQNGTNVTLSMEYGIFCLFVTIVQNVYTKILECFHDLMSFSQTHIIKTDLLAIRFTLKEKQLFNYMFFFSYRVIFRIKIVPYNKMPELCLLVY